MNNKNIYDENELVRRVAQGDVKAFRLVYNHFYLSVFRFARKYTDHHQAAEDIVTESFLKFWEKRTGFSELNKIKSFLFTAVRNACINYLRDEKRHAAHNDHLLRMMDTNLNTEYELITHPVGEKVFAHLEMEIKRLPEKMKTILQLQLNGLNNEEIAAEMGLAEKTVRNLKVEALKTLRIALLKNEYFSLLLLVLLWD